MAADAERIRWLEERLAALTQTTEAQLQTLRCRVRDLEDMARPPGAVIPPPAVEAIPEPELSLKDAYYVKVRLLTPEERAKKEAEAEANVARWRAEETERRSRIKGKSHVYFIQQGDSGAIKIGCSKNPSQRLAGLQTGHSEPLRLLTCAVGSQAQERALHDRFAHLRVSGEWFRPADDLMAYIRLVNDRRAL
jgi:hypothetical protein